MCHCEPCARVNANLARPSMVDRPSDSDRYVHARHLVRDNPAPAPKETP